MIQKLSWLTPYLLSQTLHSVVGLVWLGGLRRQKWVLPPLLETQLLRWILIFSSFFTILRLTQSTWTESQVLHLIRIDDWSQVINQHELAWFSLLALALGTAAVTLKQEAIPLLTWLIGLRKQKPQARSSFESDRPEQALKRVIDSYFRHYSIENSSDPKVMRLGSPHSWTWKIRSQTPTIIESTQPLLAVRGVFLQKILISTETIKILTDDELETAIAHECAHLAISKNGNFFLLWLIRMTLLLSPSALLVFRELIECREIACDEWASWITQKPKALQSALQKMSPLQKDNTTDDELLAVRVRMEALSKSAGTPPDSNILTIGAVVILGGLLWSIR
jgi:Zn-dependent protease with chaperone function